MQPQYAAAQSVRSQEWQNGLMSCGPCDLCLLGTFLPCIRKSELHECRPDGPFEATGSKLGDIELQLTPDLPPVVGKTSERMRDPSMQTYEAFNSDCMLMCGITYLTGCGWM